jgi:hypothetical protein
MRQGILVDVSPVHVEGRGHDVIALTPGMSAREGGKEGRRAREGSEWCHDVAMAIHWRL